MSAIGDAAKDGGRDAVALLEIYRSGRPSRGEEFEAIIANANTDALIAALVGLCTTMVKVLGEMTGGDVDVLIQMLRDGLL